ncbi:DNA-binding Lrp family transcriptional regulator [Pseudomonas synxantha]|uniref:DNA-binding Lrp family transcriptional regulator n=1 Tax=Pseudomonas synxantha TaxID=47883 RepID=A0ACC6JKW6_9PSED|nr:DNA-binding Lrp family transcriptional regulator [Pseudomonas synxantha]
MSQWQVICSPAYTGRLNAKLIPIAQAVETFETALLEIPQVVDVQGVFGESDYPLRVITQGLPAFQQLYDESLSTLPNVQRLTSTLVMKRVIQDRALPL